MRLLSRLFAIAAFAAVRASGAAAEPTAIERVTVTWEHRQAAFNYYGITTAYGCDALAAQVRRILLYLGARDDLTVSAQGCPLDRPGHNAWVKADFNVPTPVAGDQAAAGGDHATAGGDHATSDSDHASAGGDHASAGGDHATSDSDHSSADHTTAGQAAAGVPGRWNRVELTPRRPAFMDDGDCELMQELKDLIVRNFHLRRLDYTTSCFPHTLITDAFSVIGEAPQVIAAK